MMSSFSILCAVALYSVDAISCVPNVCRAVELFCTAGRRITVPAHDRSLSERKSLPPLTLLVTRPNLVIAWSARDNVSLKVSKIWGEAGAGVPNVCVFVAPNCLSVFSSKPEEVRIQSQQPLMAGTGQKRESVRFCFLRCSFSEMSVLIAIELSRKPVKVLASLESEKSARWVLSFGSSQVENFQTGARIKTPPIKL